MSPSTKPIVIALGGNALSPPDGSGDIREQFEQTSATCSVLADLLEAGASLVITHGNGPQVGSAIRRVELARHEVYALPLDVCVADLQGGMGYMISLCLNNELRHRGAPHRASALLTKVEVDQHDPAFENPTKPIGPFYDAMRAATLKAENGWAMVDIPNRGFRRVVPSPRPQRIVEIDLIRTLVEHGETIIAAGGGGIPVTRNGTIDLSGREAVIDKDLASALLARELEADTLIIVTGVPHVALDFGQPTQRELDRMTVAEARAALADGQFPPGSMGPKIEAAIDYLEHGPDGARVVITDIPGLPGAVEGTAGTVLTRE